MLADVFDMLFGCWHRKYSFPITTKKGSDHHSHAASVTGTYVVCLNCGKEFPYDWNQMKMLSPESEHTESAPLTAKAVSKAA
jgi:hypothetical protein